ncbi:MAG: ATP-binding cassette domain-containing protein [Clostridia bacterium]|nr:ATP-binding cassette domain-containing protein [Clostridia bacterium]
MIEFKSVYFSYNAKKEILNDFSLLINQGDRLCIKSPSGRGKTTLLRLIMGLEKVKKGSITSEENIKISTVFQEDRLIPFKTVLENVQMFSDEKRSKYFLERLGLSGYENSNISELSGGMKRRVALARALAHDFDLLLLDEPFTGLDSDNIILCCNVINEVLKDKTLILITHEETAEKLLDTKIINI